MKKCINFILRFIFLLSLIASIIFFLIFVSKTYLDKKLNTIYFSLFCLMILFVVASYNLIKLTLNKFDRNHKTYIAKRFSFLLEKGYKMSYRTINFESVSSFYKGNITFELINEYESIDIVVRRGLKFPFEKEANVMNILKGIDYEHNLNLLNPMQKIDLLAELVQENYDIIITYITK